MTPYSKLHRKKIIIKKKKKKPRKSSVFLLKRLQCKTVAIRCSKFRHGNGIRDATGGIRETRISLCMLSAEALSIENKMNGVITGRILFVHFSGWFTSTHVT